MASLENVLRLIKRKNLFEDSKKLPFAAEITHKFPFRTESYSVILHQCRDVTRGVDEHNITWPLEDRNHKLQEWFLNAPCLELVPNSHSGRVLDPEEMSTLLSAASAALSHLQLPWRIFVPVHDALRDAYWGISLDRICFQNSVNSESFSPWGCHLLRFESDSVHGRSIPWEYTIPSSLLSLFASRMHFRAPIAASICKDMSLSILNFDDSVDITEEEMQDFSEKCKIAGLARIIHATRRCYQLPLPPTVSSEMACEKESYGVEPPMKSLEESSSGDLELVIDTWDEDAPWRPWAAENDSIGGLELDALWIRPLPQKLSKIAKEEQKLREMTGNAEFYTSSHGERDQNESELVDFQNPSTASAWRLAMVPEGYVPDTGRRGILVLQAVDHRRQFLHLQSVRSMSARNHMEQQDSDDFLFDGYSLAETSFSKMLEKLAEDFPRVIDANDVSDLSSSEWWLKNFDLVSPVPSKDALQDIIRDLYGAPFIPGTSGEFLAAPQISTPNDSNLSESNSRIANSKILQFIGKSAPVRSITTRFGLHCLRLGNLRAIALLWKRFVRELRFSHWDTQNRVPGLFHFKEPSANENEEFSDLDIGSRPCEDAREGKDFRIDTSACLIHQHLQLLDFAIAALNAKQTLRHIKTTEVKENEESEEESIDGNSLETECNWSTMVKRALASKSEEIERSESSSPEGVRYKLENITLINDPSIEINVPITQAPPPLTEIRLAEMTRYSPHGCINGDVSGDDTIASNFIWARYHGSLLFSDMYAFRAANPHGKFEDFIRWYSPKDWNENTKISKEAGMTGILSDRMDAPDNIWKKLWAASLPIPISRQTPLFQAVSEGEHALHFMDTIHPSVLFSEIFAVAFSGAVGLLLQSPAARLPSILEEIEALYAFAPKYLMDVSSFNQYYLDSEKSKEQDTECSLEKSFKSMQQLVRSLAYLEKTIITGQSLLQRLRWKPEDFTGDSRIGTIKESIAEKMIKSALKNQSTIDLDEREFNVVRASMDLDSSQNQGGNLTSQQWNIAPVISEWCVDIHSLVPITDSSTREESTIKHRIYIKLLPAELRVSTVVGEESMY